MIHPAPTKMPRPPPSHWRALPKNIQKKMLLKVGGLPTVQFSVSSLVQFSSAKPATQSVACVCTPSVCRKQPTPTCSRAHAPVNQQCMPRLYQQRMHASLAVARVAFEFNVNPFRLRVCRTASSAALQSAFRSSTEHRLQSRAAATLF